MTYRSLYHYGLLSCSRLACPEVEEALEDPTVIPHSMLCLERLRKPPEKFAQINVVRISKLFLQCGLLIEKMYLQKQRNSEIF